MNAQDIPSAYCTGYYRLIGAYVRLRTARPKAAQKDISKAFDDLTNHRNTCGECQEHMRAMTAYAEQVNPWHMPDMLDDDIQGEPKE